jgi:hypothetical protein
MEAATAQAEQAAAMKGAWIADDLEYGDDWADEADWVRADEAGLDDAPYGYGMVENLIGQIASTEKSAAEDAHDAAAAARAASVAAGFGDPTHPDTGEPLVKPRSYLRPKVYLHFTLADLDADPDRVIVDGGKLGPQTLTQLKAWLASCGSDARITPVVDLNREWAVDEHDPPDPMREQVVLRDEHCVFPYCTIDARRCDLDHIVAYDPDGPPGQTSPSKLAPLCRSHHRMKTFTDWCYYRDPDGSYVWTSPHKQRWRVTPGQGTIRLDNE